MPGDNVTLIQGEAELKTELLKVTTIKGISEEERLKFSEIENLLYELGDNINDNLRKGFLNKQQVHFCTDAYPTMQGYIEEAYQTLDYWNELTENYEKLNNEEKLEILNENPNYLDTINKNLKNEIANLKGIIRVESKAVSATIHVSASFEGKLSHLLTTQKQVQEVRSNELQDQQKGPSVGERMDNLAR